MATADPTETGANTQNTIWSGAITAPRGRRDRSRAAAADVRTWRRGIDVPRVLLRHVGPEDLSEHGRQALGDGADRGTERHRPASPRLLARGLLVPGLLAQGFLVHGGVSPAGRRP